MGGALMKPPYISRREFTHPGVPKVPAKVLEAGSTLLEELDAPSSVAEFDHVQAKLESETKDKDAHKMEGGCLREFTRFLEKEVRAASPHTKQLAPIPISQPCSLCVASGPVAQMGGLAACAAHRGAVGVVLQGLH